MPKLYPMMKQFGLPFSHSMFQSCIEKNRADDITLLYSALNGEPFTPMRWASLSFGKFPQQSAIGTWNALLQECVEKRAVFDAVKRLRQVQTCKPYWSIPFQRFGGEAFQNHKCIIYTSIGAETGLIVWLLIIHHHPQSVVKQSGKNL